MCHVKCLLCLAEFDYTSEPNAHKYCLEIGTSIHPVETACVEDGKVGIGQHWTHPSTVFYYSNGS